MTKMPISVLIALAGFLPCALAAPVDINTNNYGMTPCLVGDEILVESFTHDYFLTNVVSIARV